MTLNTLLYIFLALCVVGVLWWGIQQIPLPPIVKTVLTVVLTLAILFWCFNLLGVHGPGMNAPVLHTH